MGFFDWLVAGLAAVAFALYVLGVILPFVRVNRPAAGAEADAHAKADDLARWVTELNDGTKEQNR